VFEYVQRLNTSSHVLDDEVRYRILKFFAERPDASQRELARELGISLGKANYCLRALIAKGSVKMQSFRSSTRKTAYIYVLTRKGIKEKVSVARAFLRRKIADYDLLVREIETLRREVVRLRD
jgi:EPS-associated MarR family transcriptional regulator